MHLEYRFLHSLLVKYFSSDHSTTTMDSSPQIRTGYALPEIPILIISTLTQMNTENSPCGALFVGLIAVFRPRHSERGFSQLAAGDTFRLRWRNLQASLISHASSIHISILTPSEKKSSAALALSCARFRRTEGEAFPFGRAAAEERTGVLFVDTAAIHPSCG